MSLQDITITASIGSLVTQSYGQRTYVASSDDQSFPIENFTGSYAGAWPDFQPKGLNTSDSASNTTTGLVVNITQSWSGSTNSQIGLVNFTHNTMEEFINGEFSGSTYVVSNGSLNDIPCEQIRQVSPIGVEYGLSFYYYDGSSLSVFPHTFLDSYTSPNPGEIYLFVNRTGLSSPTPGILILITSKYPK